MERKRILNAYGAEIVLTDAGEGSDGAILKCREIYAADPDRYFYPDQYNNPANWKAHFETTGPEIWNDTQGRVNAFVSAVGTGGTLAGTARYLKGRNANVRIVLADPHGSALYSWKKTGKLAAEGSSITEGIGTTRITANFEGTPVDDAVRVSDKDAVAMVYRLLREEGLFVGGSTGINVCAAVETARVLGPGNTIVTLLCDRGSLYMQRLFNPAWLAEKGLGER